MMSGPGGNDKTVNKVALCSAIFAGFAYVGYAVVRTAFGKKIGKRENEAIEDNRLYFRRLSQTTQTDVFLGNLDTSGSGKVMLRSVTVQERIRELNLRARMFTDTMLAIQSSGGSPRHRVVTKSLQTSPWNSPRALSPVDIQHIGSRSVENLYLFERDVSDSPVHGKWTRRSVRKSRPVEDKRNPSDDELKNEAKKVLREKLHELRAKLDNLIKKGRGTLTKEEGKILTILLYTKDDSLLEKALIAIGNYGTFEHNQNILREAGCLRRILKFITHTNKKVQMAAVTTLGNMALNTENQKHLQGSVAVLTSLLSKNDITEETKQCVLVTLANIAIFSDWHGDFCPVLRTLYYIIDNETDVLKLQALKLLINLSCNPDMVPSLLAAQAPRRLVYLLDDSVAEELLLRVVTLLSNLISSAKAQQIDPTIDLPIEDKAASPETMYSAIFGVNVQEKLQSKIHNLMNNHHNQDIRNQCRKIHNSLS